MSQLGLGVMIKMLGGDQGSAPAIADRMGKRIASVVMSDDSVQLMFEDGKSLRLSDEGQSCCEHRYLTAPDNIQELVGKIFQGASFKDIYSGMGGYEEHEVQPVEILTDKGPFVIEHHNEHNGYYGGFWIKATLVS